MVSVESGEQAYPGERLGLPESGPASVAPWGKRVAAFLLDGLIAAAITWIFTAPNLPQNWSLLTFFVIYWITTSTIGRTPGMMLTRLRLAQNRPSGAVGLVRGLARTVLLMLLVPAVVLDRDRRGLHDRVADTIVVAD